MVQSGPKILLIQQREFAAITQGNALTENARLKAQADIASAQHYADAGVAAGEAAGQASMVSEVLLAVSVD